MQRKVERVYVCVWGGWVGGGGGGGGGGGMQR